MSAFKRMQGALENKGYSADSAARITAAIGDKKYGKKVMGEASHAGISAEAMKRRLAKKRMSE